MPEAGVEEAAGDQPVPLAFGDRRPEEREFGDEGAAGDFESAVPGSDLGQVDDDVERDQDEGRRGGCRQ